jgi:large subunit ribosomal protein L3
MSLTLIGRKVGMAQVFRDGKCIVCTVLQVEANTVLQIKTVETDGYNSVQLAGLPIKKTKSGHVRITKPLLGHYKKANAEPCHETKETRVKNTSEYQLGQKIDVNTLADAVMVDVEGVSKGKGYQGVMKLHNFGGMAATHGNSLTHRHAGGTGMRTTPGRVFPGHPMASRMGGETKTIHNLKVFGVDGDCLLVEGAVPGARNGVVYVRKALYLLEAEEAKELKARKG